MQNELNSQSNDGNAEPVFWVVAQYENVITHEDYAEDHEYFDGENSYTLKQLLEYLKTDSDDYDENGKYVGELLSFEDTDDFDLEEIFDYEDLPHAIREEWQELPIRKVHKIIPDTFFISKRECREHIKNNYYHYNDTVHTYVMTAWRSPQVEKLWQILRTENFESKEIGTNI